MDQIYDNRYYSAGSREPSPRRARTAQFGGSSLRSVPTAPRIARRQVPRAPMLSRIVPRIDRCARHVRQACVASLRLRRHDKPRRPSKPSFRARTLCATPTTTRWSRQSTTLRTAPQRRLFIGIVGDSGAREPVFPRARPVRGKALERYLGQAGRDSSSNTDDELQKRH